jgi:predicted ATPase
MPKAKVTAIEEECEFHIRNFGPVKDSRICLKPLTIIIGKNGTGKSFICKLLYSLNNVSNNFESGEPFSDFFPFIESKKEYKVSKTNLSKFSKTLEQLNGLSGEVEIPNKMKEEIFSEILKILNKEYHQAVKNEIERTFGSRLDELIRSGEDFFEISLKNSKKTIGIRQDHLKALKTELKGEKRSSLFKKCDFKVSGEEIGFYLDGQRKIGHVGLLNIPRYEKPIPPAHKWRSLIFAVGRSVSRWIFEEELSYFLPAERSGLLAGYKTIAAAIVSSAPLFGLKRIEVPQFTGVVADFISATLNLSGVRHEGFRSKRRREREFNKIQEVIAKRIEDEVLFGEILLEEEKNGGTAEILFNQGPYNYKLHQVSSLISELAIFILYLRNISFSKNGFLIFEEPESHAHPGAQAILAKTIVNLIRCGIKVMVTTHSDYFLHQISNLIVPELSKVKQRKNTMKLNDQILPGEIEAILLVKDPDDGGSITEKLSVTNEGIHNDSFTNVAETLYENSFR